jgi:hypothetical protein
MEEFVFDPKVFILPPFNTCPSCGQKESYGVLMIGGAQYKGASGRSDVAGKWAVESFGLSERPSGAA